MDLLQGSDSDLLVGTVEREAGWVELYRSSATSDARRWIFAGHRDAVLAGRASSERHLGFSVLLHGRCLRSFHRISCLNGDCPAFALPLAIMWGVINATGLALDEQFRYFPGATGGSR
jgi:hypothetical protein